MTRVFVRHAAKDKVLVDDFVDLLLTGVNVQPHDIFCTSLEGMGIPLGQQFVEYIKDKIQKPEVVLLLISEHYLHSQFCTQEAGAAWALSLPIYPFLVPSVDDSDLKAVLVGMQAGRIDNRTDLNNLRDDLIEKLALQPLRTAHWEAKREKFLNRLTDILSSTITQNAQAVSVQKVQPVEIMPSESPVSTSSVQQLLPSSVPSRPVIERLEERLQQAYQQRFTFLLIGQTGVGKSSTVNSLFEEEIAPVGHEKPTTLKVKFYKSKIQQNVVVVDTPGLCDDLEVKGKDKLYLSEIRNKVPEFHCLWFVTPLYETRLRPDERRAIRLVTQAFGEEVWDRAVIIFTFADYIQVSQYSDKLFKRSRAVRNATREYTSSRTASKIPSVAVSNISPTTPDREPWYEELFVEVADRIAEKQALPFLLTIVKRRKKLSLNNQQKERVRKVVRRTKSPNVATEDKSGWGWVVAGGMMGAAFIGLPGAVVGGLLGGLASILRDE
jgi:predicted GTPase